MVDKSMIRKGPVWNLKYSYRAAPHIRDRSPCRPVCIPPEQGEQCRAGRGRTLLKP